MDADGHADLAAGRAGQHLAERDEVGVGGFRQPAPTLHVLLAEVAEVGGGSAEGGEAKPGGGQEHFPYAARQALLRRRRRRGVHACYKALTMVTCSISASVYGSPTTW